MNTLRNWLTALLDLFVAVCDVLLCTLVCIIIYNFIAYLLGSVGEGLEAGRRYSVNESGEFYELSEENNK